jgi:hypothetical protein
MREQVIDVPPQSYEDYKEMQARDSYSHAINSKELKRMVH